MHIIFNDLLQVVIHTYNIPVANKDFFLIILEFYTYNQ
jgi:hypothetical protein